MIELMRIGQAVLGLAFFNLCLSGQTTSAAPLRVGIAGLAHGHVSGFLHGGALVPAGGILNRADVQLVGVAEGDRKLFEQYQQRDKLSPDLYYPTVRDMIAHAHPQAVLIFTSTYDHTAVVEECARNHVHVLMEKPMAVSYRDALRMEKAAQQGNIHVLVDYETTWYPSNKAAHDLLAAGALGKVSKAVVHDGHRGPKLIHVEPEFFAWLTDPKLNGAGALYDFGCYGVDLMTWMMKGEAPKTVTAVTQQQQPEIYPRVDDEADITLTYGSAAVALVQGSWNWPFDRKDMELYGRTGSVKTILRDQIEVRREGEHQAKTSRAADIAPPLDDPMHYLAAVIKGEVSEDGDLSSFKTNLIVSEVLDAARRSASSGKTVMLPLNE